MQQGGNRKTEKLLLERSVPGRVGVVMPDLDVPAQPPPDDALLRNELALPEVSEPEVVQYFTGLSQLNFSIEPNPYPMTLCCGMNWRCLRYRSLRWSNTSPASAS